jgi:hypothetical protein
MGLHLEKFNPFICEMKDLETDDLQEIKKRQIIAPFDLKYYYSRFLQWRPNYPEKMLNYEKSELRLKKLMAKVSYTDMQLIMQIIE